MYISEMKRAPGFVLDAKGSVTAKNEYKRGIRGRPPLDV